MSHFYGTHCKYQNQTVSALIQNDTHIHFNGNFLTLYVLGNGPQRCPNKPH